MTPEPRLARVAAMVADPARSRMLSLLLGGDPATAGELARAAGVSPATASGHLARLQDTGLVCCEPRGRHRWYRLAGEDVAHALEALAMVAEADRRAQWWQHPARAPLRLARCCYGHLAGQLGVQLHRTLLARQALAPTAEGFMLTEAGQRWCEDLGATLPAPSRRRQAYACFDWSERQDHLAGALADALLASFITRGWLRRGEGRVLTLTPSGRRELLPRLDHSN